MPNVDGIMLSEETLQGCEVTTVAVQSEQAAKALKKSIGTYITIQANTTLDKLGDVLPVGECLAEVLDRVLSPYYHGKLCICGMGNRRFPHDSLGPEVTYNLPLKMYSGREGNFRDVCSFDPGVSMITNIDTEKTVAGVAKAVEADCVLLIDSSIAQDISRLSRTIQLSTTGGVSSYLSGRKADWGALGVPVISLVVPTIIPLSVFVPEEQDELLTSAMVKDVIVAAGSIIAYAILRVCWPTLSKAECFIFSKMNKDPIPFSAVLEEAFEENTEGTETSTSH